MSRSTLLRAIGFAHLAGFAGKNARADDQEDDQDDAPKGRRADNDDQDDNDDEPKSCKAKGQRAEDDTSDEDDDDTEPKGRKAKGQRVDEDEDGSKGRRTAAEDDDEDEEERQSDEDDADPKARAARKRERARCAAIFGSKHAAGRVASAAHLAFNTKMTASAAIGVLMSLPKQEAVASGLSARMGALAGHRPSASAAPAPSGRQKISASWDAAFSRAGINCK